MIRYEELFVARAFSIRLGQDILSAPAASRDNSKGHSELRPDFRVPKIFGQNILGRFMIAFPRDSAGPQTNSSGFCKRRLRDSEIKRICSAVLRMSGDSSGFWGIDSSGSPSILEESTFRILLRGPQGFLGSPLGPLEVLP